jgi:hypothetical protein
MIGHRLASAGKREAGVLRTIPVSTLLLIVLLPWIGPGCASMSVEEEEFLRRHSWFMDGAAREAFRNDGGQRDRIRTAFARSLQEKVRPEFLDDVKKSKVTVGMTSTEVRFSVGVPDHASLSQAGGRTLQWWTYGKGAEKTTLAFENEILTEIWSHERKGVPPTRGGGAAR